MQGSPQGQAALCTALVAALMEEGGADGVLGNLNGVNPTAG